VTNGRPGKSGASTTAMLLTRISLDCSRDVISYRPIKSRKLSTTAFEEIRARPRCAAHKRRRTGRICFRARRNRNGLHVAKPPQRSNLSSIARRVKSCPVQTPSVAPNVPKIAAEVEE